MNTHLLHYFNTFEDISFKSTIAPSPIKHCEIYLGARNPQKWNVKKSFSNNVDEYLKMAIVADELLTLKSWFSVTLFWKLHILEKFEWNVFFTLLLVFHQQISTTFKENSKILFCFALKTFPRTWVLKFSKQSLELEDIIYN